MDAKARLSNWSEVAGKLVAATIVLKQVRENIREFGRDEQGFPTEDAVKEIREINAVLKTINVLQKTVDDRLTELINQ